jgi:hypothetical protein
VREKNRPGKAGYVWASSHKELDKSEIIGGRSHLKL